MGGTAGRIDIRPVRIVIDYIGLRTKCVKDTLCNGKCASVGTVQADLHIFKRTGSYRNQVSDVTVSSGRIVDRTSDPVSCCQRNLFCLTIDIGFDLVFHFCFHLISLAVDQLDTVVIERVVADQRQGI